MCLVFAMAINEMPLISVCIAMLLISCFIHVYVGKDDVVVGGHLINGTFISLFIQPVEPLDPI